MKLSEIVGICPCGQSNDADSDNDGVVDCKVRIYTYYIRIHSKF